MDRQHVAYRDDSLALEERDAGSHVPLVGGAGERRESALDAAVVEKVGELPVHERPFDRPKAAAPKLVAILRLTGLRRKKLRKRGFFLAVSRLDRRFEEAPRRAVSVTKRGDEHAESLADGGAAGWAVGHDEQSVQAYVASVERRAGPRLE